MGEPVRTEDLNTLLREIERRLHTLETAPRGPHTSVKDGQMRFLDDAGNQVAVLNGEGLSVFDVAGQLRARLGYINPTSGYGVSVFDVDGQLMFESNDDGFRSPWLASPWRNQQTPATVTTSSSTFIDAWTSDVQLITHKGAAATAYFRSDVGTTGELRLSGPAGTTDTVVIGSGAAGAQQFNWLHGVGLGVGPVSFALQLRRTSGAGAVYLDEPGAFYLADPSSCDASGIP